jgi:DNA-binding CsgD family transcriptional regulator
MLPAGTAPVYDRRVEALKLIERPDQGELTPREHEVLERVAAGAANKLIALNLGMSEHTVKFHLAGIFRKLGVTNRTEAATMYVRGRASR